MTEETQAITDPGGIFSAARNKGAGAKIDAATLDKLEEFWNYANNLERRALARFSENDSRTRVQCALASAILSAIDACALPKGHELEGAGNQLERQILRLSKNEMEAIGIPVPDEQIDLPYDTATTPTPTERLGDPDQ